ncbi:BT1A1 protein, partial [Atractosteus spatula]|nr:BT1A1 protein [Atractosteus spatula]
LSETFQVLGPPAPVVVSPGEDAVLPCSLSPSVSAVDLEIRWFREDYTAPVCLFWNHTYTSEKQVPAYRGRAELFPGELVRGNASLKLRRVRDSDDGEYTCMVASQQHYEETLVHLAVRALGSQPSVSLHSPGGGQTQLLCRSEGWFPAPAVIWTDRDGHDVTSLSSTTVERDSQGLLSVSSYIPVQQESNIFSCLVRSAQPGPDWGSQLHIPTFISFCDEPTALGSQPSVSLHSPGGGQTQLLCRSEGWFPAPAVIWTDRDGHDVTSLSSTTVERDSQGLLSVSSYIPVQQESNIFSCLVRSAQPGPDWGSQLHIPRDFFPGPSGWMVALCVAAAVAVAASALLVIQWRRMDIAITPVHKTPWTVLLTPLCFFTEEERMWEPKVIASVHVHVLGFEPRHRSIVKCCMCDIAITPVHKTPWTVLLTPLCFFTEEERMWEPKGTEPRAPALPMSIHIFTYVKGNYIVLKNQERESQSKANTGSADLTVSVINRLLFFPAGDVTLDPDTAHPDLLLSGAGKRVRTGEKQELPDNPQRFDYRECVLARQGFTSGRHYWEVEGNDVWRIGVSRESAQRKGWLRFTPREGYWSLQSVYSRLSALTEPETPLPPSLQPRRVGMCVDIEERKVSFYNVESRTHIYTFTDMVFNREEQIYPVFWTWDRNKDLVLLPPVSCIS